MNISDRFKKVSQLITTPAKGKGASKKAESIIQADIKKIEPKYPEKDLASRPLVPTLKLPKNTSWKDKFEIINVGDGSDEEFRFAAEIWTKDERLVAEVSKKGSSIDTYKHIEEDSKLFTKQELSNAMARAKELVLSWAEAEQEPKAEG